MAVLTTSGRTAFAIAVASQPLTLAWGSGDPAWDAAPGGKVAEGVGDTALVAELGRKFFTVKDFVVPDAQGPIIVPSGRFSISPQPTNRLFIHVDFDYADASTATIRECGVFLGTTKKSSVPAGQVYLLPADLDNPGTLLALQHVSKITRDPALRQGFEFVLTI